MNVRRPYVYLRKSHLANADNDLESHKLRCLAKMKERGEIDPVIISEQDGHRSAFSDAQRPGYRELEARIKANQVSSLYINDRARVWRNALEYLTFLMFAREHGTDVVPAIEAPIGDVSDPNQQLLEFINGWKNERYRTDVANSLKATKQDFRMNKLYVGNRPRFGLQLTGTMRSRKVEPSEDFYIVVEVFTLYTEGQSADSIALTLRQRGRLWRPSKTRQSPIQPTSILNLIRNAEEFKPFLDPALYDLVIRRRAERLNENLRGRHSRHPILLLKFLLRCEKCNARYFSNHHQTGTISSYLHPTYVECDNKTRWVRCEVIDAQVWDYLETHLNIGDDTKREIESYILAPPDPPPSTLDYELQKQKLEHRLSELEIMRLDGDIAPPRFRELRAEFAKQLAELKPPKHEPPPTISPELLRLLLVNPIHTFRRGAPLAPEVANRLLRDLCERVTLYDGAVKVTLIPELSALFA